jgi:hypothetical protein
MDAALDLDSARWTELTHAYGDASDIPKLLRALESTPPSDGDQEPWFSLWSALAHQGNVYPASFAAIPYVVQALAAAPTRADSSYFQFPAWIEICRARSGTPIPSDLLPAYLDALARLPSLAIAATNELVEDDVLRSALAAIAAAKGAHAMAEALLELSPEVLAEFETWLDAR